MPRIREPHAHRAVFLSAGLHRHRQGVSHRARVRPADRHPPGDAVPDLSVASEDRQLLSYGPNSFVQGTWDHSGH